MYLSLHLASRIFSAKYGIKKIMSLKVHAVLCKYIVDMI